MSSTLNNFLLHYSYFAVFILSFISSMGIPAGAEVAIIGGGALASGEVHKLLSNGQPSSEFFHLSLVVVILLALGGELLGSIVGYLIALPSAAQTLSNQSLSGKYYFRYVSLGTDGVNPGNLTDTRTLTGTIT